MQYRQPQQSMLNPLTQYQIFRKLKIWRIENGYTSDAWEVYTKNMQNRMILCSILGICHGCAITIIILELFKII